MFSENCLMSPGEAEWVPLKPSAGGRGAGLETRRGAPLTVDEAQAGCVQQVLLQVILTGAAVLPAQHLLPAGYSPNEGQVVTAAVLAQQCLHLAGAGVSQGELQEATSGQEVVKGCTGVPESHGAGLV